LSKGHDFIADIIALYKELESGENDNWREIQKAMEPLFSNWGGQKYLEKLSRGELLEIAKESMNWTIDKLVKSE